MTTKGSLAEQLEEQKQINRGALAHQSWFLPHRQRLTDLICAHTAPEPTERLCVLGAGNCSDLDLPRLAQHFAEVHLVDIDGVALEQARQAQTEAVRQRLELHELDLSGLHQELEAWRDMRVTEQALLDSPKIGSRRISAALPGDFDVVVSACLLSQLQFVLRAVLSDRHQLFQAVRQIQNLVHLRSIVRLLAPGGRGLLVSDLTSNESYALHELSPDADLRALASDIYSVNPELIALTMREDPYLVRHAELLPLQHAWLWQNGPLRTFLVYALELRRR
jgi:hypothetical protein